MKTMTSREERATITAIMGISSEGVSWSVWLPPGMLLLLAEVRSTVGSEVVSCGKYVSMYVDVSGDVPSGPEGVVALSASAPPSGTRVVGAAGCGVFGESRGSLVGAAGRGGAGAMVAAGTVVNTASLLVVVVVVVVVVVAATVGGVGEAAVVGATGGVASVTLRRGATGGFVGLAVWTGPSVGGVRPWPEAPRARLSSRSRGHTPILPLRCEIGINHSFAQCGQGLQFRVV